MAATKSKNPYKDPELESSWKAVLGEEFGKPYMVKLREFLLQEKAAKKKVFPHSTDIFKAFELTPFDKVKVVILGQDPYHGINQAHGLCFSVKPGVAMPPSLINIYKELKEDLNITPPKHGCLACWAKQGVLLLNCVLTVEQGLAASHQGKGWEDFTNKVIELLNRSNRPLAFVLWGSYAQRKGEAIDENRHLVIRSAHPSPLSAHRGFFGSKPFSKINQFLEKTDQTPIDWQITEESE
ncbi:MAG TPA: uracil-DNA glycosylase [Gammaproteobacteria bacterium]|nr:uracil-DNA glycosylase [Gammaproteobacteria bacterium]